MRSAPKTDVSGASGSPKQSRSAHGDRWIASSQGLLAMMAKQLDFMGTISSEAQDEGIGHDIAPRRPRCAFQS